MDLRKISDEHLWCKVKNHAWETCGVLPWYQGSGGLGTAFSVCVRCASDQAQDVAANGDIERTHIYHSPGYRRFLDQGGSTMTRAEARRELVRRQQRDNRKLRLVESA